MACLHSRGRSQITNVENSVEIVWKSDDGVYEGVCGTIISHHSPSSSENNRRRVVSEDLIAYMGENPMRMIYFRYNDDTDDK